MSARSTPLRLAPCPHCLGPGVSIRDKSRSSREYPAACTPCGGRSHVIASTRPGSGIVALFLLAASHGSHRSACRCPPK